MPVLSCSYPGVTWPIISDRTSRVRWRPDDAGLDRPLALSRPDRAGSLLYILNLPWVLEAFDECQPKRAFSRQCPRLTSSSGTGHRPPPSRGEAAMTTESGQVKDCAYFSKNHDVWYWWYMIQKKQYRGSTCSDAGTREPQNMLGARIGHKYLARVCWSPSKYHSPVGVKLLVGKTGAASFPGPACPELHAVYA